MAQDTKLKLAHKSLHCPVCGERFMNIMGQPLPNHAQLRCLTSAGNTMDIGVCENCINSGISVETVQAVLAGIQEYWVYEIQNDKNVSLEDKNSKIAQHNSHRIAEIQVIVRTGKEAESKIKNRTDFSGFTKHPIKPKRVE